MAHFIPKGFVMVNGEWERVQSTGTGGIMQKELIIQTREVYGNTMYYPMNEPAKALARIAGTKTLTLAALWEAQIGLGYKVTTTRAENVFNVVKIEEVAHG
jgi:hypothetical protein